MRCTQRRWGFSAQVEPSCGGVGELGSLGGVSPSRFGAKMNMKILDDTAHWPIYLVAIACVAGFVAAVIDLARRRRLASQLPQELRSMFRRTGWSVFYVVTGGIASWFFITSMFFRFHAVGIGSDRVELIYYWPRPAVSIEMTALDRAEVVSYRRRGGYMQIATRDRVFRSVDFRHLAVAGEIRAALAERVTTLHR